MDFNPTTIMITINLSYLKTLAKWWRISDVRVWGKSHQQKTHYKCKDIYKSEVKSGQRYIMYATQQQKNGFAISISDEVDFGGVLHPRWHNNPKCICV